MLAFPGTSVSMWVSHTEIHVSGLFIYIKDKVAIFSKKIQDAELNLKNSANCLLSVVS